MKTPKPLWLCLTLLFFVAVKSSFSQTTMYSTNFGTTAGGSPSSWTFTGVDMNVSTHSPKSSGYSGASGQAYLSEGNSADFANTFGTSFDHSQPGISTATLLVNTSGYNSITLSFGMFKSTSYDDNVSYSLQWSNNGSSFTPITYTQPTAGSWGLASGSGLNLPAAAGNQPTLYIRWSFNRTGPNFGVSFRLDDVKILGTVTTCTSPSVNSISSNSPVCAGATVTLSSSFSGTGPITYSWSGPNGFTSTNQNPAISGATAAASGTYTVTATNSCGTASATASVTVNPLPTVGANATSTSVCAGNSVTLTGSGASTYVWSGSVSNGVSFTPSSTTTYTVTGTDANGCSATASVTITVNPLPAVGANATATTVCPGSSVTLTGSGASTYAWSGGVSDGISFTPSSTATYTVTGTDANGCSATSSVTVTIGSQLSVGIDATSSVVCSGNSVTLSGTSALTYSWSGGVNDGVPFIPASTSTYTVTGTDGNGCSGTSSITITVNPLPAAAIIPNSSTTFCQGGSVTLNASSGASYVWSNDETTPSINVTSTGNYTVQVTDANGCSATSTSTHITVNPLPIATITPISSTTFCQGGSVALNASSASSYLWSTGATAASINVNTTGSFSVTVTDPNGCSATSPSVSVTVNSLPVVNANTVSVSICLGSQAILFGIGASNYSWSGGVINALPFTPSSTATYTVTGTDGNGCTASASLTLTVNPLPATPVITPANSTTFCQGDSVILTSSSSTGYHWNTFQTSQSITADTSGNYLVTISDINGCTASSNPVTVTVHPLPSTAITPSGPTTFCPGGSVTLTAAPAVSYLWSTGDTTQSIFVDTTGNYSITVTDINGCTATSLIPQAVTIVADPTDINRDGITNNIDFLLFLAQFNNACASCPEDINHNGVVNNVDFLILLAHFNMVCQN